MPHKVRHGLRSLTWSVWVCVNWTHLSCQLQCCFDYQANDLIRRTRSSCSWHCSSSYCWSLGCSDPDGDSDREALQRRWYLIITAPTSAQQEGLARPLCSLTFVFEQLSDERTATSQNVCWQITELICIISVCDSQVMITSTDVCKALTTINFTSFTIQIYLLACFCAEVYFK